MVYLVLLALPFCFNRLLFTNFFRILTAADELTPSNLILSFLVTAPCNQAYSNTFSPLALVCTSSELFTNSSEGSAELLPFLYFALIFGSMKMCIRDRIMTIAVIGEDSTQSEEVLATVQSCTSGKSNTYCYAARTEEVQAAHETGLSYGKYRAYLELQELDPTVTVEQIQTMTMREIRERIWELSGDGDSETQPSGNGHGQQGNGNGQGQQNRWGRTNIP